MNNYTFDLRNPQEVPASKLQRDSYDYGYGAGRVDLPAVGYNPVYPTAAEVNALSYPSAYSSGSTYQSPYASQINNPGSSYASPYTSQQYNPNPPNYHQYYQEQRDTTPTTIITVDKSRYSLKNNLAMNKNKKRVLINIPQAPIPPTFCATPSSSWKINTGQAINASASTASGFGTSEVITIRDFEENTSQADANVVNSFQTDKNSSNSSSAMNNSTNPIRRSPNGKVAKKYEESLYGGVGWGGYGGGYTYPRPDFGAPWHSQEVYGRRAPYSFPNKRLMPRPFNSKDDIPFVPLPADMESLTFKISSENIECFNGASSIFTTQHVAPVLIDNSIYESVDHYYQFRKVMDLCGNASEKITGCVRDRKGRRQDGKTEFNEKRGYGFSQASREQLKLNSISKNTVEEWRRSKGLKAIQDGLFVKLSQNQDFRLALKNSGEKILVHAFGMDSIYGTGSQVPQVAKWCKDMEKSGNSKLIIPATFPLTEETIKHCPTFSHGRNILGVILMQLREMLANNDTVPVDIKILLDAVKNGKDTDLALLEDMMSGENSFSIGGGEMQSNMVM